MQRTLKIVTADVLNRDHKIVVWRPYATRVGVSCSKDTAALDCLQVQRRQCKALRYGKLSANVTFAVTHSTWTLQQIGGERKSTQFGKGIRLVKLVSPSQQTFCLKQICSTAK